MKDNEIIKSLEKIYSVSEDLHSIYTPLDLCDEMISSITKLEGDILVISNLEFLITLKRKGIDMNTVHYTVNCELKKQVAINLGINENNIYNLDYNKKEINLGTKDMKFDVVIQNPPYNPNSLWKKFVLMGIDLLKDDGQMVAIHPVGWRESSKHKKLYQQLIQGISTLYSCDAEIWKDQNVAIKIDWYCYNKSGSDNTNIIYSNGDTENVDLKSIDRILRFSTKTSAYSILKKITKDNYHNGIIMLKGWDEYKNPQTETGKYKQCGGIGNGTGWTKGNFVLTSEPTEHQFENKVVMAYAGKPRAQYFSKEDNVGVLTAYYWLTNNKSLPILLNSKMFIKLAEKIYFPDKGMYRYGGLRGIPAWLLKSLNFENLNVKTEQELYEHYGLTEEEIEWIEND